MKSVKKKISLSLVIIMLLQVIFPVIGELKNGTVYAADQILDMSLRKYIVAVNGEELTGDNSREPVVDTTPLKNGATTAEYKHRKDPVEVKAGDEITYRFQVYNEGNVAGVVGAIVDCFPEYLEFVPTEEFVSADELTEEKYMEKKDIAKYTYMYINENNAMVILDFFNPNDDNSNPNDDNSMEVLMKLDAYSGGNSLDSKYIDLKFKVNEDFVYQKDIILTNSATMWYSSALEYDILDRDSDMDKFDLVPELLVAEDPLLYIGNSENKEDLTDRNYYYKGQEDDDDFEKIIIKGKEIDLSLRKYIVAVNGEELTGDNSREPVVDTTPLKNGGTTAEYKHKKDPVEVEAGDEITYRFHVYNEGNIEGYVFNIIDYLPVYLEFIPTEEFMSLDEFDNLSEDEYQEKSSKVKYVYEYNTESNEIIIMRFFNKTDEEDFPILCTLNAYNGGDLLDNEYIDLKFKVKDDFVSEKDIVLTNVATMIDLWEGLGYKDRDSTGTTITVPTQEQLVSENPLSYKGNSNNNNDLANRNYYYKGQEDDDDFEKIIIKPKVAVLTGIEITKQPNRKNYVEGQNFDATGMEVTATYSDGTSKKVTNYEVINRDNLRVDQTAVTIKYEENGVTQTVEQAIEVIKKQLTSIQVTTPPNKTIYKVGEKFDATGMIVTAIYNDGETKVVKGIVEDGENLKANQTTVKIIYVDDGIQRETTQSIVVTKKQLTGIEVKTSPNKTDYIEGQSFDATGMEVIAKYSDETSKKVTDYKVVDGDNLKVNQTKVTIKYKEADVEKEATIDITVEKKQLTSIQVTTLPNKREYIEGQNFNKAGMVVTATYNNGETNVVEAEIEGGENLKVGQETVTVKYKEAEVEKEATIDITVEKKQLTGIQVITYPNKISYIEGQNFETTGMKILATYNNDTQNEVEKYKVVDGENLKANQETVTIRYEENGITKDTIQNIVVIAKQLSSIEVKTPPNKTNYIEGENFDKTGMEVKAIYSDNTEKVINDYEVLEGENLSSSKISVTISYKENGITKTVEQNIVVTKKEEEPTEKILSSIKVSKAPTKINYIEGENFDKEGMEVKATYTDNTEKAIESYVVVDGANLKANKETVTIRYAEGATIKETTQTIVVTSKQLIGIKVTKTPNKTTYKEGENFDKTGMEVKAIYSDNTEKVIESYVVVDGANLKANQEAVTIRYEEEGVTQETSESIVVIKKQLESIKVTKTPIRISYTEGENFDRTGMEVTATYSDGSSQKVTDYTVVDGESLKANQTVVTIRYEENGVRKETTQTIVVTAKVLTSIKVNKEPSKKEYTAGEKFDATGMEVVAIYSNGKTSKIENYTIVGGESLKLNQQAVTIEYIEKGVKKETTIVITVNENIKELDSIKITKKPEKVIYVVGENFDATGMEVTATYSDGSSKKVTNYTIVDGNNLSQGKTSVTIKYVEGEVTKTATQSIVVTEKVVEPETPEEPTVKTLISIAVSKAPEKVIYLEGENFDPTGMEVTATYSDGTSKKVTNYTIIDGNNLSQGKTSVTIKYVEGEVTKTTTQSIVVITQPYIPENNKINLGSLYVITKENVNYIRVEEDMTISKIKETIKNANEGSNLQIQILDEKGKEITEGETIKTNYTIRVTKGNTVVEYKTVKIGYINSDNKITVSDLIKLLIHIAEKNAENPVESKILKGAYLLAANITGKPKIDVIILVRLISEELKNLNIEKEDKKEPEIIVYRDETKLHMKIRHDMGFEKVEFAVNGQIYTYDKNYYAYDSTKTELYYTSNLKEGENQVAIIATSNEDTQATYVGTAIYP